MQTIARAKMVRISPRKVSLVAALVRGQSASQAQITLANTNKGAAEVMAKVLDAAIANAENNQNLKRADLTVESVLVGAGATLKRIRPRSRGQANRIMKRTSHITVVLTDSRAKVESAKAETKPAEIKDSTPKTEAKASTKKPATKATTKKEAK